MGDILLEMEPVKLPVALKIVSLSLDIKMSEELLVLKKPVTNNQYPLPSMPKNGLSIPVVSSLTVELLLITVSYLLVILVNIGLLKTLGVNVGVKMVISDLNLVTLVVLLTNHLIQ